MILAILLQAVPQPSEKIHLSEPAAFKMFLVGILVVGAAWTITPLVFVLKNQTDTLLRGLREGSILRYVTITYIVLVAVTLSLVDKLDGDKVATLLASIAGYVLGQGSRPREEHHDESAGRKKSKTTEKERLNDDEPVTPAP